MGETKATTGANVYAPALFDPRRGVLLPRAGCSSDLVGLARLRAYLHTPPLLFNSTGASIVARLQRERTKSADRTAMFDESFALLVFEWSSVFRRAWLDAATLFESVNSFDRFNLVSYAVNMIFECINL